MTTSRQELTGTITTTKQLGQLIRKRRIALGLGIEDAAAWCNVGSRFLFEIENGKSTVQFVKTIEVAGRFDIRLCLTEAKAVPARAKNMLNVPQNEATATLVAPNHDVGHWLGSRIVASMAARSCGIDLWSYQADKNADCLYATPPPRSRPLISPHNTRLKSEEQGGPGFSAIFAAIDQQSKQPILDVKKTLRWAIFAFLIGDTNISGVDIRMVEGDEGDFLAAFPLMSCSPALVSNEPAKLGLKIGHEWPSDWMRADHWISFSREARVQPKIVLSLMAELSATVPAAVNKAAVDYYRATVLRGAPEIMVRTAVTRANRTKELLLSASHHGVSGIVKPVKEIIQEVIEPPYLGHETFYE
jgi:HTH-type transcriptional regulator/antitoxin HipB